VSRQIWVDLTDLQYEFLGEILQSRQELKKESRALSLDEWAPRWMYRAFAQLARAWHGTYLDCLLGGIPQVIPPAPKLQGNFAVAGSDVARHVKITPADIDVAEVAAPTEAPPLRPGYHRITIAFPENALTALERGLAIQNRHNRNYPESYNRTVWPSFLEWANDHILATMSRVKTAIDIGTWDDAEDAIYPGFSAETRKIGSQPMPGVEPDATGGA
jgi:hypothetical protein